MNISSAKIYDRIADCYHNYGLKTVIQISYISLFDYLFDFRFGTDTVRQVELKDLSTNSENYSRGHRYALTPASVFRKLLNKINFSKDSAFVDLGCGKGKILLFAAEYGFKRVTGIEFTKELSECSKKNISIYKNKTGLKADIEVVHSDVVDYEIKDDDNVFYLFNPFDDIILGKVLDNINASYKKNPRNIYLIYYIPYHSNIIEQKGNFTRSDRYFINSCEFVVYVKE
jgi:SAM-dependent methyltransferase